MDASHCFCEGFQVWVACYAGCLARHDALKRHIPFRILEKHTKKGICDSVVIVILY